MATPYIVQSLHLKSASSEFDLCKNVEPEDIHSGSSGIASHACRYNTSWCTICDRETENGFVLTQQGPSCLQAPSRCRDEVFSDGNALSLRPVVNRDETFLGPLVTNSSDDIYKPHLAGFAHKSSIQIPTRKNAENCEILPAVLPREIRGVHDKYAREVEVLKGKIQQLRENLQKQLTDSPPENLIAALCPKLSCTDKLDGEVTFRHEAHSGLQQSQGSDRWECKRVRKVVVYSEKEAGTSVLDEGVRDFNSQQEKDYYEPSLIELSTNSKATKAYLLSLNSNKAKSGLTTGKLKFESKVYPIKSQVSGDFRNSSLVNKSFPKSGGNAVIPGHLSETLHPSLRSSLFPEVPPYVKFASYHRRAEKKLPPEVLKVLKWKITNITPLVVRRTVIHSGYRLVKQSPDWVGTWGKHMRSAMFRTIREDQKINHYPGTFQIGRKDKLWKNLHRMMATYSKSEFGFIPRTYILPQETRLLRVAWERGGGSDSAWIIKPPASSRGSGIKVVNRWSQIPKKAPLIVQKYISNPYLINGNKFDLRMYILVTSIDPMRVYLYTNGLVRFASAKYSDDLSSLNDRYVHLTNYSINKLSNNYLINDDVNACQGHKWSIKSLWSFFESEGVVDVKALWESLADLVVKTVICGEPSIADLSKNNLTSQYCSFELFGVDVLLDHHLRPWLLEVNISPSLHSASPLDIAVKGPLVHDILNMANYHIPDRLTKEQMDQLYSKLGIPEGSPMVYDKNLYIAGLSSSEISKHVKFQNVEREQYLESILEELTPDDVRQLIHYEDELTQIGSFEKVFPTTESHEYLKYMEGPQYYNKLLDAWETHYASNRQAGVDVLSLLCKQGVHKQTKDVVLHVPYCPSEVTELDEVEQASFFTKNPASCISSLLGKTSDTKSPDRSRSRSTTDSTPIGSSASSAIAHILSKLSPDDRPSPASSPSNIPSTANTNPRISRRQYRNHRKTRMSFLLRSNSRFSRLRSCRTKLSSM